ncbi:MAG: hypothetical protein LBE75_00515 [Burkholderiales bacterium]|jgi:hypothetical protein|nr:hypothetical protein [Burkholderiales bacterium]
MFEPTRLSLGQLNTTSPLIWRLFLVTILVLVFVTPQAAQAANGRFGGGTGTSSNPYIVQDAADLDAVRNNLAANYRLASGIHLITYFPARLSDYAARGWQPIGDSVTPFTGTFDGAGHTITGLRISRPAADHVGLFGYAYNATIQNLNVSHSGITGRNYVGGLVGAQVGSGIFYCTTSGNVTGQYYVGGLVGGQGSSIIIKSDASGRVKGKDGNFTGGLVGIQDSSSITNLVNINPHVPAHVRPRDRFRQRP